MHSLRLYWTSEDSAFRFSHLQCQIILIGTKCSANPVTSSNLLYVHHLYSSSFLVIDCGFVKLRALHPNTGIESLMVVPISRASAEQRAGRAGRLRAGQAYRLYPESEYERLHFATVPEVQRSHLAPVILQLKALGIENVLKFHYLSVSYFWSC